MTGFSGRDGNGFQESVSGGQKADLDSSTDRFGCRQRRAVTQLSLPAARMQLYEPNAFAPLPGTEPAARGIFIDRWGTLLVEPPDGEPKSPEVVFHEGALDALFKAHRAGWYVYLVGNEDDVAFGRLSDEDWTDIQEAYTTELRNHGVVIRREYACLDHPEGVGDHRFDSVFLLPNSGLFHHAVHNDGIQLGKSWVVGDETLELVAGWRAGCRLAGVRTGRALGDAAFSVEAEFTADTLAEAVLGILGLRPVQLSR
jgi:histidinol phosphatase-like enzyme